MTRTIDADDLDAASAAGILSDAQARDLSAFLDSRRGPDSPSGEEELRFIRNFHDVFLSIGLVMLGIGLAVLSGLIGGQSQAAAILATGVSAGTMWALGEVFSRRRRLFLPSIVIALGFAGFVIAAASIALDGGLLEAFIADFSTDVAGENLRPGRGALWIPAAGLAATLIFYLRFRLPFATGMAAALGALTLLGALANFAPEVLEAAGTLLLPATGLATFLLALAFDARDPGRRTRYSDNAFWLHLAAAPQIVHGTVFWMFTASDNPAVRGPLLMLALVAGLGLVALLINRRALLVSALIYAGVAVATLLGEAQASREIVVAITLLILGGSVVALGAGWHAARRGLLKIVPSQGAWARLFPPERMAGEG